MGRAAPAAWILCALGLLCGVGCATSPPQASLDVSLARTDLTDLVRTAGRRAIAGRTVVFQPGADGPALIAEHRPGLRTFHAGVWIDAGSLNDPPGRNGLAHLIEHLVFRSASDRGLDRVFAGSANALTTTHFTYFHCSGLAEQGLERLSALLSAVFSLRVENAGLEQEKRVVEREMAFWESDPLILVLKSVLRRIDAPEDIRETVIGSPRTLRRVSMGDVAAFYAAHYPAARVVLFVSGDLRPVVAALETGARLVVNTPLPAAGDVPPRRALALPKLPPLLRFKTLVKEVYAGILVTTPGWHEVRPEEIAVLDQLLGGRLNGRIAIELRERYGVTDVILQPEDLGVPLPLLFPDCGVTGAAVLSPGDGARVTRRVLTDVVRAFADGRIGDEEIRVAAGGAGLGARLRFQESYVRGLFYICEYRAGRARTIEQYHQDLAATDPADARRKIQDLFASGRVTVLMVQPARGLDRLTAVFRFLLFGQI